MTSARGKGQARAPADARAGSAQARDAGPGTATAPAADLLALWRSGRDSRGGFSAARFDVTDLATELLPDLFVVRVVNGGFSPVMSGARVGDPLARLSDTEAGTGTGGALERCRAGGTPVHLKPDPDRDQRIDEGILVPLTDQGRVSHIAGILPAGADAAPVTEPFGGLPTANLPMIDASAHQEILAYWQSKKAGRWLPSRRDIDPVEIPRLLRHLMLVDVLGPPLDFRYRLLGDEILLRARPGLKGRRFSEIAGKEPGSSVFETARKVAETGLPRYGRAGYVGPDRFTASVSDLLLPLSEDDRTVSHLAILALFRTRDPKDPDALSG